MNNSLILHAVPPTPAIGVGGIVFNERSQVLLIQRGQPPAEGLWSIPGGRLEPGECLASACEREFLEETTIEVSVKQVVAVVERKLEGFHYVIIDFLVALRDEGNAVPMAQSDVLDAKWIDVDKLGALPLVEGLADIILRAHTCRKGLSGLRAAEVLVNDYILPILPAT